MIIDKFKEFFEKKCPSSLVRENEAPASRMESHSQM